MLNKVTLIGNLGADPDIRSMQNGNQVCNLNLACSERWKDKTTGERKEKTEWVNVVVFSKGLIPVCEQYLSKGSKIYIEGKFKTRSWEQDGVKKYTTEVVLDGFDSKMIMLDSKSEEKPARPDEPTQEELEDSIPF